MYINHAFLIHCTGIAGIWDHFHIWRTAIPDFVMEIDDIWPEQKLENRRYQYSIQTSNTETFVNDLKAWKATGKKIWFLKVVDFVVNEETELIEELNKWYTARFCESEGTLKYNDKDRN